jgi:hypothetical protein
VAAHDLTGREGGFPRADEGTRTLDTWLGKLINCVGLCGPLRHRHLRDARDRRGARTVTFGGGTKHFPQFSPDGESIA